MHAQCSLIASKYEFIGCIADQDSSAIAKTLHARTVARRDGNAQGKDLVALSKMVACVADSDSGILMLRL